jgi:hypothetical protein
MENKSEKLQQNQTTRIYINNVFGKNVNAYIGPVFDGNTRAIFAQGAKGGSFWKVGRINIETCEIEKMGEENYAASKKIIDLV